jgi:tripartite-type tricarboxylate transporter receptor subunit TctC
MKGIARGAAIGLVLGLAVFRPAVAADYPERAVTILVPFAPGGGTDVLGRILARKLGERFGKTFVVENRSGAGTSIAAAAVAKAPPDGYTLLMSVSSTFAVNPTLYKKLPYDPDTELVPVSLLCTVPFVLVVNPALPVKSVRDLIKLAKEKPGQLSYGSGGVGAAHHLFAELFKSMTGTEMTHVPYKGSLPALTDVVAGNIQWMFSDLAPSLPLIKAGKLRALAVTTRERAEAAPDIPPLAEVGVPGYDAAAWQMLAAPAGIPDDVLAKLNGAVNDIVRSPEVSQQFVKLGLVPLGKSSPDELKRFVKSEGVRWSEVVKRAGIAGTE